MREVPVGEVVALVDDADYELVAAHKWYLSNYGYPATTIDKRMVQMHTLLTQVVGIDHENNNKLDNTRKNLRPATPAQNSCNRLKQAKPTSSKYKGVYWHKHSRSWVAVINHKRRRIHLGTFANEEDAARAYDEKAKELFGEFARPNFPEGRT
jgi:hypothetical protein